MAGSSFRRAAPIQAALACSLVGCFSLGPIWAPRVEGRVVDAVTRAPVAGAEVFASYSTGQGDFGNQRVGVDSRSATSDADGRFVIEAHLAVRPVAFGCATSEYPDLLVYHERYGAVPWALNEDNERKRQQLWRDVVIEVSAWDVAPDAELLDRVLAILGHCAQEHLERPACERLCELSVGRDACARKDELAADRAREAAFEAQRRGPPVTGDGSAIRRPVVR